MKKDYKNIVLPPKYAPKKTEKYMCDEHKAFFYKMLLAEKEELERELSELEETSNLGQKLDGLGAMDEGDAATLSIEADFNIKIKERNMLQLKHIETALERLADGTYGYSIVSGEEIGLKRLMVRPVATMTIEEREANGH